MKKEQNEMIEDVNNGMFKYNSRKYELIFPFWILEALVSDRHEQAELANGGERNINGMIYSNTTYVKTTLWSVTTTFRKRILYVLEDYRFERRLL